MIRRRGITLVEVLVAIFVMALGLLALLTLFPLGALTMRQAIRDDRCAQASANAVAALKVWDVASDANVTNAMTNGLATTDGPSWAVLVDPVGYRVFGATPVGGAGGSIPRVWPLRVQNLPTAPLQDAAITAWCVMPDDITFTAEGVPANANGTAARVGINNDGQVVREGRYSWAAMLRRPRAADPVTEVSVVVYSGRSVNLSAALTPLTETPYNLSATGNPGNTLITLTFSGDAPPVKPGTWLLDSTPGAAGHGYFYRVAGATLGNGTLEVELQTPLKASCSQVVVMEGVAEVFDKGAIGP